MRNFIDFFNEKNYIASLKFDAIASIVEVIFVKDPDCHHGLTTFVLLEVIDLQFNRYHPMTCDDVCLGDCHMYEVKMQDAFYQHYINTGDAVIKIVSSINEFQFKC